MKLHGYRLKRHARQLPGVKKPLCGYADAKPAMQQRLKYADETANVSCLRCIAELLAKALEDL